MEPVSCPQHSVEITEFYSYTSPQKFREINFLTYKSIDFTNFFPSESKILIFPHCVPLAHPLQIFALCLFTVPLTPIDVVVGCSSNSECPEYAACLNGACRNPCAYDDPCAPNAFCKVIFHSAKCACPAGYIGDPQIECILPPRKTSKNIKCVYPKKGVKAPKRGEKTPKRGMSPLLRGA